MVTKKKRYELVVEWYIDRNKITPTMMPRSPAYLMLSYQMREMNFIPVGKLVNTG
jgi:hypothetical protein